MHYNIKCSDCGHDPLIRFTIPVDTSRFSKCPKCGSLDYELYDVIYDDIDEHGRIK